MMFRPLFFSFVLFLLVAGGAEAGQWYRGDIHSHTDHSDGGLFQLDEALPRDTLVSDHIGAAEARGLDFIVISDHRTMSQYYDMLHTSRNVLMVPGSEWGSSPHGVVFGSNDNLLNPGYPDKRNTQSVNYWAHAQDALFTMSHPGDSGNGWWFDGDDYWETERMDLIEVWNSGPFWFNNEQNRSALDYWDIFLRNGQRIVGVGASDIHFKQLDFVAGIGRPCTHVYADRLTQAGIIEGFRAGRVYVTYEPGTPVVEFTADSNGDGVGDAMMGDIVKTANPAGITLRVRLEGASGQTLHIYNKDGLFQHVPVNLDPFVYTWKVPAQKDYFRLEIGSVVEADGDSVQQAVQALSALEATSQPAASASPQAAPHLNEADINSFDRIHQTLAYMHGIRDELIMLAKPQVALAPILNVEAAAIAGAGSDGCSFIEPRTLGLLVNRATRSTPLFDMAAITNPIYIEPDPNAPWPTPVVTPPPRPRVLFAGYWDDAQTHATADPQQRIIAVVDSTDVPGESIQVELLRGLIPTGFGLSDVGNHGDFAANDTVYGLFIPQQLWPQPESPLLFGVDVRASGGSRSMWPYLEVRP